MGRNTVGRKARKKGYHTAEATQRVGYFRIDQLGRFNNDLEILLHYIYIYSSEHSSPCTAALNPSKIKRIVSTLCVRIPKKTSTGLILLLHLSLNTVDEGHAINPSCSCIRYTSTYGKERGTFSSPDYPRAYPPRIDCLLYTFVAAPHEIVELVFTDFDIYKGHLDS
ncbi:hypothetical protein B5X24_HaOG211926 [Helicoverpa armigera]|uniref:CUB domain-containing protein n=1 Tax=Helicoverpa armigera TaxID=29058 RepID=A0A2W1BFU4_HELAM|nr:hypothetical protein B5X24_HaOG211926 [Helicoverpa armigera]